VLFWTPLTFDLWTKTVEKLLKISYFFIINKKKSYLLLRANPNSTPYTFTFPFPSVLRIHVKG